MGYGLVSTTTWVGISGNMRVNVILKMNACLPCVVETKGSATLKIVTNPFFRITLIYGIYIYICIYIYIIKRYF
jgi:heme O synthase-like polyprenyltransferase